MASDTHMADVSSPAAGTSAPTVASSRYTYVVTAHPPTVVTQTLVCRFTSPDELNLIVAKNTRLEIYRCVEDGIETMHDVAIYGRIASMFHFRGKNDVTDRLFITTDRHKFFVLKYDRENKELRTESLGDAKLKIGRQSEQAALAVIDPTNAWIGLHQYDGLFQMLGVDANGGLEKTLIDCKFDELQIIQLAFLHKCAKPTVLVLSMQIKNGAERRVLKCYTYEAKEKEMRHAPQMINFDNCDAGAAHVIPTVFGGAILLAEESISYFPGPGKSPIHSKVNPWHVTAWCAIEPKRFLIGDLHGGLYVLLLEDIAGAPASTSAASSSSSSVPVGASFNLRLEYLGTTSVAHRLQYIDNGFVLVGSIYGDSQLIRLSSEPVPAGEEGDAKEEVEGDDAMDTSDAAAAQANARPNFVRVISTFPSLGSVVDVALVDLERSGQCQLLTCSGAYKDGSLRVIRNGIGITEEASIELEGIQGVWGIKSNSKDEFHKYLVQTYASETRMLALEQEEDSEEMALAECEIEGFDANQRSIFVGNMGEAFLLQVTQLSARLIDSNSSKLVHEWKASSKITVATANNSQILIAMGKQVVLLGLNGNQIQQQQSIQVDEEVACMDLSAVANGASFAALCMWRDNTVRLYNVPQLDEIYRDRLGDMMARSVLFTTFESPNEPASSFLLCGLGDGNLASYEFNPKAASNPLSSRKKIALGTSGLELNSFRSRDELHVFVCCDRPTVVSHAHGKLRFSNVNLKDLTHMTPFHAPVFKDCLALVSGTELMIGHIDEIEKLHIKKVATNGQPRRLAHQKSTKTIAVVVVEPDETLQSLTGESNKIKLYDDGSFRKLSEFALERDEMALSIYSCKLNVATNASAGSSAAASAPATSFDNMEFYIVGTGFLNPDEPEPSSGRILVLAVDTDAEKPQLKLVANTAIKGSAYTVDVLQGRIVAGVNAKVVVYRCVASLDVAPGTFKLEKECDYIGNSFVLRVKSSADGNYVMVQDLFKSVNVLAFNSAKNTNSVQTAVGASSLEEVSRHFDSLWLTAMESFSQADDVMVVADQHFNFLTLRRQLDGSDEDRRRLETIGQWHSGECVNAIARGSLVMNLPTEGEAASTAAAGSAASSSSASPSDDRVVPTHVFGCTSGMIGVLAPLTANAYRFFAKLEECLESVVRGVGGLSHREWRQFQEERRVEDSKAFIDGDLIQLYLELTSKQQEAIATKMGMKVQEVLKKVEDASRIH